MGKPVIMGRKTLCFRVRPSSQRRTTIVVSRDPEFARAGVVGTHRTRSRIRGGPRGCVAPGVDAIVFAGGAEIYAGRLPLASRLVITRVHRARRGDTHFPAIDPESGARPRASELAPAEGDDALSPSSHYQRQSAAAAPSKPVGRLPAAAPARHRRALQGQRTPLYPRHHGRPGWPGGQETFCPMPWSNQSGGPWGSGRGALGLGSAAARAAAARSRRIPAPQPGPVAQRAAGQSRRPRRRADRAGGGRPVGLFRLLPRRARRARRGAPLRQVRARGAARARTITCPIRSRPRSRRRRCASTRSTSAAAVEDMRRGAHDARRAGGEPDADRRREHRRRRFLGAVEGQAERRRRLSVQHAEPRRHGEGGRRKRDARGDRALATSSRSSPARGRTSRPGCRS